VGYSYNVSAFSKEVFQQRVVANKYRMALLSSVGKKWRWGVLALW